MDSFMGGTNGYWRNRYYQRLDADDPLSSSSSKPPSARRRKLLPSFRRRKVAKFDSAPASQSSLSSASAPTCTSVGRTGTASRTASTPTRRRRFWRIRLTPRVAFLRRVAAFPARLLSRLQHGYVRMMLKFSDAMSGMGPEMGGFALPRPAVKEYDEKVLVDIYRALVAQGHVLVVPAAQPGPDSAVVSAAKLVAL